MQITYSFVTLLGSILAISTLRVNAIPLTPEQTGVISLPLKSISVGPQDLDPRIVRIAMSKHYFTRL